MPASRRSSASKRVSPSRPRAEAARVHLLRPPAENVDGTDDRDQVPPRNCAFCCHRIALRVDCHAFSDVFRPRAAPRRFAARSAPSPRAIAVPRSLPMTQEPPPALLASGAGTAGRYAPAPQKGLDAARARTASTECAPCSNTFWSAPSAGWPSKSRQMERICSSIGVPVSVLPDQSGPSLDQARHGRAYR